jgi:hypothetical protein
LIAGRAEYNGLDAIRIKNTKGDELVVVTGIGPRIMSFTPEGGTNLFYVNDEETVPSSIGNDSWLLYGGTRLWLSPEAETSYLPDNRPCEVRIDDKKVSVISPVDQKTKLRKIVEVEARSNSFTVTYTVSNEGTHLFTAGIWALSCIKPLGGGTIYLPWGEPGTWNIKEIKYWRSWLGNKTNVGSEQWKPTNEFFIIKPSGEVGKVGFANRWEFALYTAGELSFIKQANYIPTANYPDGGCSFEVYTCDKFYEIETLSPVFDMKPGRSYSHSEQWWAGFDRIDTNTAESVHEFLTTALS